MECQKADGWEEQLKKFEYKNEVFQKKLLEKLWNLQTWKMLKLLEYSKWIY